MSLIIKLISKIEVRVFFFTLIQYKVSKEKLIQLCPLILNLKKKRILS